MPSDETRRILRQFGVAVTEFEDAVHQNANSAQIQRRDAEARARLEEITALIERLRRQIVD